LWPQQTNWFWLQHDRFQVVLAPAGAAAIDLGIPAYRDIAATTASAP
jgi:hypothetical protein